MFCGDAVVGGTPRGAAGAVFVGFVWEASGSTGGVACSRGCGASVQVGEAAGGIPEGGGGDIDGSGGSVAPVPASAGDGGVVEQAPDSPCQGRDVERVAALMYEAFMVGRYAPSWVSAVDKGRWRRVAAATIEALEVLMGTAAEGF